MHRVYVQRKLLKIENEIDLNTTITHAISHSLHGDNLSGGVTRLSV